MTSAPTPAIEGASSVVRLQLDGQEFSIRRGDLKRYAMARQLAQMKRKLIAEVHRTDKGLPVDLKRNYQWNEIWSDPSPDQVIMASAQVGKSLNGVLMIFAAAELGLETGWVMPTDPKRNEFVHNRIERTIEHTPYYKSRIRDGGGTDNTREKHYRALDGTIAPMHFATAATANELIAFSADLMGIDEYDRCDRTNLALYPSRMNQSSYRLDYKCSTPTFPGYKPSRRGEKGPDNIETKYLLGDQRRVYVKCPHCDHEQCPTWYENVVKVQRDDAGRIVSFDVRDGDWSPGNAADVRICCMRCDRPFDRLAPGVWKADNPGAAVRSYWVNRLLADIGEPIGAIVQKFQKSINDPTAMQQLHNMDLGISYAGGMLGFQDALLERCARDYQMVEQYEGAMATTAGIDVNEPFYDIQISGWEPETGIQHKLHAAKVIGRENVYALLRKFNVKVAVIEQQPSLELAQEIQINAPEKCGTRVIRCRYSTHSQIESIVVSEKGAHEFDIPRVVTLDRTGTLDQSYQSLVNKNIAIFSNYRSVLEGRMLQEMTRPVRTLVIGESGIERYAWVGDGDHQLHAFNFDRLAGVIGKLVMSERSSVLTVATDYTQGPTAGSRIRNESEPPERVMILRG